MKSLSKRLNSLAAFLRHPFPRGIAVHRLSTGQPPRSPHPAGPRFAPCLIDAGKISDGIPPPLPRRRIRTACGARAVSPDYSRPRKFTSVRKTVTRRVSEGKWQRLPRLRFGFPLGHE